MVSARTNDARRGVPSTYVRLLFDYLRARGIDAEALLDASAPEAGALGRGRVSVVEWRRMLERASDHLDDPCLGLRVGQTITPSHAGMLGYVVLACDSVGAAIERYVRYEALFYDERGVRSSEGDGVLRLEWGPEFGRAGPLVEECAIAALVQTIRNLATAPIPLVSVRFVSRAPSNRRPYSAAFGCPVRFESASIAIVLPTSALGIPLASPDSVLLDVLDRQADALLAERGAGDDVFRALVRLLPSLLAKGDPSVDDAAAALRLSTRTMHRRLEAEGSTYRDAIDRCRRELAFARLRDARQSMSEIAESLRYSDQSAFTRAFRRWTGMSPTEWRRRHVR